MELIYDNIDFNKVKYSLERIKIIELHLRKDKHTMLSLTQSNQ